MSNFSTGWLRNDKAVEDATIAISAMQGSAIFGDHQEFRGYAQRQVQQGRYGHFPHLAEKKLFGSFLPAFYQKIGSCVGCGTTRACQDGWFDSLVTRSEIGRPTKIAMAPIYAGARVQIGQGRVGNGDGAVGAWAAQFVAKYGLIPEGTYGGIQLVGLREDLAKQWGAPGRGVPAEILRIGEPVQVRCFRCTTEAEIFDAAFTPGTGLAFCGGYTFGPKDADGLSRMSQPANHCTELVGGFVTKSGEPAVCGQQSWGPSQPSGTRTLKYKGGEVDLREGMCGVRISDIFRVMRNGGECWAFQIVHGKGFREAS